MKKSILWDAKKQCLRCRGTVAKVQMVLDKLQRLLIDNAFNDMVEVLISEEIITLQPLSLPKNKKEKVRFFSRLKFGQKSKK